MDHRAALVHEQGVLPAPVRLDGLALVGVLVDRVADGLRELRLHLASRDGDAVDEQDEVEGLAARRLVMDLVHKAQDVRLVALARAGHALVVRVAGHALDRLEARHREAFAQSKDGAFRLEVLHQRPAELAFPAGALLATHLVELFRLGPLQPSDEVVEDEGVVRVEADVVVRHLPSGARQLRHLARDVPLEGRLLVDLAAGDGVLDASPLATGWTGFAVDHFAASVQSVLPVTAWWMMDLRYSPSFSMSCSWREIASSMSAQRSSR